MFLHKETVHLHCVWSDYGSVLGLVLGLKRNGGDPC